MKGPSRACVAGEGQSVRGVDDGGFAVEERGKSKSPNGPCSYVIVHYYDSVARSYRFFFYDSDNYVVLAKATLEGNTLRGQWTREFNGRQYECRSESVIAPDGRNFAYEWSYSEDGQTWKPMVRGTGTRVGNVKSVTHRRGAGLR